MKTSFSDRIKSLQYESERVERRRILNEPHIKPLTEFVNRIRTERKINDEVPYFDPCDGGVNARVLFLLEAAGPKAKESGFISRNNNDMSAENMFRFLKKADLSREVSLLWNIVPWYLGDGKNIKPATKEDIREGSKYLEQLLHLLGNLKAIVLVGKKAQDGFMLVQIDPNIQVFKTVHPSPSNVNSRPEAEEMIVKTFKEVAAFLKTS